MPPTSFDAPQPTSSDKGIDEHSSPSNAASPSVVSSQGNRAGRNAEASSERGYRGSETGTTEMAEEEEEHRPQSPYIERNLRGTPAYPWYQQFAQPEETLSDRKRRLQEFLPAAVKRVNGSQVEEVEEVKRKE
ncbi:uncharacterized protein DFL_001773 [Arthrobotrys flagrans]|uniref:Uncharacterized protein n=1 Tax=Arthrobotrys flagrans TaxID=97331 RepID=A0A437A8J4_ARTFL|nr:hypothetical protein DFL_001773 [Arthrobotrys flagrans]